MPWSSRRRRFRIRESYVQAAMNSSFRCGPKVGTVIRDTNAQVLPPQPSTDARRSSRIDSDSCSDTNRSQPMRNYRPVVRQNSGDVPVPPLPRPSTILLPPLSTPCTATSHAVGGISGLTVAGRYYPASAYNPHGTPSPRKERGQRERLAPQPSNLEAGELVLQVVLNHNARRSAGILVVSP